MSSPFDDSLFDQAPDSAVERAFNAIGAPPSTVPDSVEPVPVSVGAILLDTTPGARPLVRRRGAVAEEATLRARAAEARAVGDGPAERDASMVLARALAAKGVDLEAATTHARRALALGDDPTLRSELAGWLAGIGDHALAAKTLRGLCDPARPGATATTLVRLAVLLARGGDATGAADSLREAARLAPNDPIPNELLGTLAAWADTVISPAVAAGAFVAAAARRDAAGERDAGLEDRLRAFEIAPADDEAAEALAGALDEHGQAAVADEVRRAHAAALLSRDAGRARRVHLARLGAALDAGDAACAAGALFDGELEADTSPDLAPSIERALEAAGLHELLEARRAPAPLEGPVSTPGAGSAAAAATLLAATRARRTKDRATALLELAVGCAPEVRAGLFALAAELYLGLGAKEAARKVVEAAHALDPAAPRVALTRAAALAGVRDHAAAVAVEEAIAVAFARGTLCDELAASLEAVGELSLALAWTQRWLALRPGSPRAIRELLRRAMLACEAARLQEALVWVLAQAEPLGDLDAPFAEALSTLASLDPPRALAIARRALNVLGPRSAVLRACLLDVAERADDPLLAVNTLARWSVVEADPSRVVGLLVDLTRRRTAAEDFSGAARDLVRAAEREGDPRVVLGEVERLWDATDRGAKLGADGAVALAEAKARALSQLLPAESQDAALAWRELAGLRWDFADDRSGAELALFTAAQILPRGGIEVYARDLRELAGAEAALSALLTRADAITEDGDRRLRAAVLIEAANLAAALGRADDAIATARDALTLDASRAEAVAVVERCVDARGAVEALDAMYDDLAAAALGCYGRRAAHYRAARKLEQRGALVPAFRHAIACFEAVPTKGTAYHLLLKLAADVPDASDAVLALERVAAASDPDARAAWLRRAAALADRGPEGARLRFDVLLRAMVVRPEPAIVAEVGQALAGALAVSAGEEDLVGMRFGKAARAVLPKLDGPEGARTALAIARVWLRGLDDAAGALAAIERATSADGDVDEFERLVEAAPGLAADPIGSRTFLENLVTSARKPYSSVGLALLRFGAALAHALDDRGVEAALLAEAARRTPDDEALVGRPPTATAEPATPHDEVPAADPPASAAALPTARAAVAADVDLAAELERARRTGDRARERRLLEALVDHATDDAERLARLRQLAPLARDLGEPDAHRFAEAILRLDPGDVDAINLLEERAAEQADHSATAALLTRRIAIASDPDVRRALRLRRAAVLEQRLHRLEDAAAELTTLLDDAPEDVSALRFLADVRERLGAPLEAAALWLRVSDRSAAVDDRAEHGLRAAQCSLDGGDLATARRVLDAVASVAPREAVLALRAQLARRCGEPRELAEALVELAALSAEPPDRRAELLLEASRASASAGDDASALEHARRAAKVAPLRPDAVLEARRLEYRAAGSGTPRDAQTATYDLARIEEHLEPDQVELYAFLLAEELDVIQGGGAGMRELTRRHAEIGPAPLIALGMAERLGRNKSFAEALPLYERALAGSLLDLRSRGRVALAGADAAHQAGDAAAEARLLDVAAAEADTHAVATRRRLERLAATGSRPEAQHALQELARTSTGLDRARALAQLGQLAAADDPTAAMRHLAEAMKLASADRSLISQIAEDMARLQGVSRPTPMPRSWSEAIREADGPVSSRRDDAADEAQGSRRPRQSSSGAHSIRDLVDGTARPMPVVISEAFASSSTRPQRGFDEPDGAPVPLRPTALGANEEALVAELMKGSYDAGERLVERYVTQPDARSRDVLAVRKRQAALRPGERPTLDKLRQAARADGSHALAEAVDHVLRGFDVEAEPLDPPPLGAQHASEDLVASLLFRAIASPACEALALAWETGLYRRDPHHYGLTGVERVQPAAGTVVGDAYRAVARPLGLLRTPLFHHRASGPLAASVALLSPAAVVLTGAATDDTPELRFALGAALTGAMPPHVLVNAMPEETVRDLFATLTAAFGPVGSYSRDPAMARRVQDLWRAATPRAERRLRELFADPAAMSYEDALASTRQAMWRAGLFASGDLATAVRMALVELAAPLEVPLAEPDGLARACEALPALADLVRLATKMEYAEARWTRPPSGG